MVVPSHTVAALGKAYHVSPEWRIRIQAAFQESTDNTVSKTVNLLWKVSLDVVDRTFRLAFNLGCKGIIVYRDASRKEQTF